MYREGSGDTTASELEELQDDRKSVQNDRPVTKPIPAPRKNVGKQNVTATNMKQDAVTAPVRVKKASNLSLENPHFNGSLKPSTDMRENTVTAPARTKKASNLTLKKPSNGLAEFTPKLDPIVEVHSSEVVVEIEGEEGDNEPSVFYDARGEHVKIGISQ